jgi:UDP-N-acetylmuramate dehydrogenase
MPEIKENFELLRHNTFRIDVKTRYFVEIASEEEAFELLQSDIFHKNPHLILGGGSNILFTHNYEGLIIHPAIVGINIINETDDEILVKVGSGVVWDKFVEYAVTMNWGGIENLSDIPGSIGASPVQNIGAYGVEVKDVVVKVEGINLSSGKPESLVTTQCKFEYRNSVFKNEYKNNFLICGVTFRLHKSTHTLKTHYGAIEQELANYNSKDIATIRAIICKIRQLKLPNVEKIGNAGSFFKNPVVTSDEIKKIQSLYGDVPVYPFSDDKVKISAAWLIDKAGCKGLHQGNAGTYDKQPLVLINLGNAKGQEIVDLANYIKERVIEKFSVQLEPEVNIF